MQHTKENSVYNIAAARYLACWYPQVHSFNFWCITDYPHEFLDKIFLNFFLGLFAHCRLTCAQGVACPGLWQQQVGDMLQGKERGRTPLGNLLRNNLLQVFPKSLGVQHHRNPWPPFHLLHVFLHFCRALQVAPVLRVIRICETAMIFQQTQL